MSQVAQKGEAASSAAAVPTPPLSLWNQYDAVLTDRHKTNNVNKGFHNQFRIIVAKHHSDLYSTLMEILKEQTNTEISLAELALGRKV